MYARVATFSNDPANVDSAIAKIRANVESGTPSMPAMANANFLLLADHESGKMIGIALFDSEEAMRAGDEAMNAGPGVAGARSGVEFFEVPVHTLG
jgi:hypothetical protein